MQTIVHIIDNLKRGGAEVLLLDVVKGLTGFNNFIITLTSENDFSQEELKGIRVISLECASMLTFPSGILRLRRLLRSLGPHIVHAHLPLASFFARLTTPASTSLFISIHNKYSQSLKAVSYKLFLLERQLHSSRERLIFVSEAIRKDYEELIGVKGQSFVLYNFIADKFFRKDNSLEEHKLSNRLRFVSVGNLKHQKNFKTLIGAFRFLNDKEFCLDVYGEGSERKSLELLIADSNLKHVRLMGITEDIQDVLPCYDAFILASVYEGFGLAPLEAGALGLPLFISDIDVFKEVTKGYAVYINPHSEVEIAKTIEKHKRNFEPLQDTAIRFKDIVRRTYSRSSYLEQLTSLYALS